MTLQSISHPSLSEPLTRIHALKVSTLRGNPLTRSPRLSSPLLSRPSCPSVRVRVHVHVRVRVCEHVAERVTRVCEKTTDIKRADRTWNPKRVRRDGEKLMARQERSGALLLLGPMMTRDPAALNICHLFIIGNARRRGETVASN